jgi:hypothetical protein
MMWASFYKAGSSHGCVMSRIPANIQSMALSIRGFMRVRGFSMDLTLTPPRCFFIASSAIGVNDTVEVMVLLARRLVGRSLESKPLFFFLLS